MIGLAWRQVRDSFRSAGIETAELDARLLAQAAFQVDALRLVSRERELATAEALDKLHDCALRRLKGEPVARLLGHQEFWGLDFELNSATLVPRPETEMLVAEGVARLGSHPEPVFLDLGTGSGAITVALLKELPRARAVATDISGGALAMAEANAKRHRVGDRATFLLGDWFAVLEPGQKFDLIVSNPPYVPTAVIGGLKPEVKDHDPLKALDGGMDGLQVYRIIAGQAQRWLKPGGAVAVEIGSTQGPLVTRMMSVAGFSQVELARDLAGLDRVVSASHVAG